MTRSEIQDTLHRIAGRELSWDGDLPDGDLSEVLDSVQRLTFVVALEDHFEVCFEPEEESQIRTVDHVVALIQRKLAEG